MLHRDQNARTRIPGATEIVAAGYAYPSDIVDNDAFFSRCQFAITEDRAALVSDTRMKTRAWCAPGENTWTLARDAVAMAMAQSPVPREEIDVVLVSSCSTMPNIHYPDPKNPIMTDLSPLILRELGRDDGMGLDIKGAYCSGFIRGLQLMDALLENPNYRAGLLVASDVGGMFATGESNRSAFCFIVGDAAGAVVLRKCAPARRVGLVDYIGHTEASKADLIAWGPDGASLLVRGSRAQSASLELLLACGRRLLARNRLTPADIDWVLPAQTHARAVDAVCEGLGFPPEKLLWRGDVTGYAASASIPACLGKQLHEGTVRKGDLVLSLAVGAGMNCAGALYYC
ncbi:3-oxoacyl-[acyl-carrier-protein] synthase III C-terminal domain-containing protein [Polyangium aurulentum]|uniref:3-oxoacyl-[acyl-carrier-protein] synthase III C-terminal domain-containing protein n=1 Tax=Polyangium aurulentum TaxID=2567896 RepID=UPI0010AE8033|nr:3-oxoacyl-[acyl-carrier-protein] synthase III C-terminal domain-containing protein [Polyangium aurulentum]UQA61217.1 hypothetical protein E8A73_012360 [Polyangium aurulentum]